MAITYYVINVIQKYFSSRFLKVCLNFENPNVSLVYFDNGLAQFNVLNFKWVMKQGQTGNHGISIITTQVLSRSPQLWWTTSNHPYHYNTDNSFFSVYQPFLVYFFNLYCNRAWPMWFVHVRFWPVKVNYHFATVWVGYLAQVWIPRSIRPFSSTGRF